MAALKTRHLKVQDTTLRHLWLAGLGVAATARRNSFIAANGVVTGLAGIGARAVTLAGDMQAIVRDQGESGASRFSAEVEARLAPVLAKLGLKQPAPARGRKSTGKAAGKRSGGVTASRKPATGRKTASARA